MEYIREMLLRAADRLGAADAGRRKCGRAEGRSRLSSHGENVSGQRLPHGRRTGRRLGPADGRFVGTASRALGPTGRLAPLRRGRRCGWSWPGSVQNGSIRPPSDRLAPERPPILPGGGIP